MKFFLSVIASFIILGSLGTTVVFNDDSECYERTSLPCDTIHGTTAVDTCVLTSIVPTAQIGDTINMCFSFVYTSPFTVGYINVTGICGPVAQYNYLDFELYNYLCDSMIVSGQIYPVTENTSWIYYLTLGQTYTICYTWIAQCQQSQVCPTLTSSALPVELVNFAAIYLPEDECTELTWVTATEMNVSYFAVDASINGQIWLEVDQEKAIGTSIVYQTYTIEDCGDYPAENTRYYRLRSQDWDGTTEILSVIAVKPLQQFSSDIQIYNIHGVPLNEFQIGINIVKRGDVVYKVIKYSANPEDIVITKPKR